MRRANVSVRKWLVAFPSIVLLSVGLPALVAGSLWWFIPCWSDAVYILLVTGMWVGATAIYTPERRVISRSLTRRLLGMGLLLSIPVAVYDRTHGPALSFPVWWSILGLALCALSVPVGLVAWRVLGRSYAPDPAVMPGQRLVTSGIYATIRHPMYTAALLWIAGLPLIVRSLWGFGVGFLLTGVAVGLRIRQEEAILLAAFGDEYRAYRARTKRLIPFIF